VIWTAYAAHDESRGPICIYIIDLDDVWLLSSTILNDEKVYEIPKSSPIDIHHVVAAFTWQVLIESQTNYYSWSHVYDQAFKHMMFHYLGELELRGVLKDDQLLERIVVGLDDMVSELLEINFMLWCDWLRLQPIQLVVREFLLCVINTKVITDRDVYLHEDVFVAGYHSLNQEGRLQVWKMIGVLLYEYL
jgi:hypothetical protein